MKDPGCAEAASETPVTIVVIGASGDLARKKVIPALFALFSQDLLPKRFQIIGFARRPMTDEEFRNRITEHLTCRYVPGQSCAQYMTDFLARCSYVAGQYDSRDSFLSLYEKMRIVENDGASESAGAANRIYYMAIPPSLFFPVAKSLGDAGLVSCGPEPGWSRAVIEKPFGRDRASSDELVASMGQVFTEDQTYRIDHYLGKEIVQNLLVLRFANLLFDPIWNRNFIQSVEISWKEDIGVEDRAGYFDDYGIIRDVVQNHLLQILALVAMEHPVDLDAMHVRDEKVKVLRGIAPVRLEDIVVGQYARGMYKNRPYPAYREEKGIPPDSITPTFAATVLKIDNHRWAGVPFLIRAGKGLDERKAEICIRFQPIAGNLFRENGNLSPNELIVRVQPDEAIYCTIMNKAPGLDAKLVQTALNLRYEAAFSAKIPDAYECLLLDVICGDKSLFIRWDELAAAWDIFTPVLRELDEQKVQPVMYPFGSAGPAAAYDLARRHGIEPWQASEFPKHS